MYNHKSVYFQNYGTNSEQDLLENLIIESISIFGEDVLYIPRVLNNYDPVYTADDSSSYEKAYSLVMYIESFDNFQGQGDFMSKMGLQIKDQVIFSVAKRVFNEEVGENTNQPRPYEGDLIYFPLNNKVFQIKYVDKFEMFYQLGKLYLWKMTTELFEYSNETFSTGIPDIDSIQNISTNVMNFNITDELEINLITEDGNYLVTEKFDIDKTRINDDIEKESDKFVRFTEKDPFAEGLN